MDKLKVTTGKGRVTRTLGGFYSIHSEGDGRDIQALIRGRLKKEGGRILVGDLVSYSSINDKQVIIEEILPRSSVLMRPKLANVDRVVITFSFRQPAMSYNLLDRYLFLVETTGLKVVICLNKVDLEDDPLSRTQPLYYHSIGYPTVLCSAHTGEGMEELRGTLTGGVNVFAGPSGVGKSALLNALNPDLHLKTGEISWKLKRGRHTTRQAELFLLKEKTYVADTPGFSSLWIAENDPREVQYLFPEFIPYLERCYFNSCIHMREPKCGVKEAVKAKKILESRYQIYMQIIQELKERNDSGW